jgi:hypothetical protein
MYIYILEHLRDQIIHEIACLDVPLAKQNTATIFSFNRSIRQHFKGYPSHRHPPLHHHLSRHRRQLHPRRGAPLGRLHGRLPNHVHRVRIGEKRAAILQNRARGTNIQSNVEYFFYLLLKS